MIVTIGRFSLFYEALRNVAAECFQYRILATHNLCQAVHRLVDTFGGLVGYPPDLTAGGAQAHPKHRANNQTCTHSQKEMTVTAAMIHRFPSFLRAVFAP